MINGLLNALMLMLAPRAALRPGVEVSGVFSALLAVALIALVNALLGPILALVRLPAAILTRGLFLIALNGMVFCSTSPAACSQACRSRRRGAPWRAGRSTGP